MEDSLADATGKGISIEIKGNEYKANPLTIDDIAEFESYIRSQRLKEFLVAAGDMDPKERIDIIKELLTPDRREASEDEEDGQDTMTAAMSTMQGIRFLLFRMLRANPGIELDSMGQLVDMDNIAEVSELVNSLGAEPSGPPEAAEESGSRGD